MALYFTREPYEFNWSKNTIRLEVGTTTPLTDTLRLGFKVWMQNLTTLAYEEVYSGTQRFDENGQSQIDLSVMCDPLLEYYVAQPYDNTVSSEYVVWKKQSRLFKVTCWESTDITGTTISGSPFRVVKGGTAKEVHNDEAAVQQQWFDIAELHPVLTNRPTTTGHRPQELYFVSFLMLQDVTGYKFKGVSTLADGTTITGYITSNTDYPTLYKGDVVCLFYPISAVSSSSVVSLRICLANGSNVEISRSKTLNILNTKHVNCKTLTYINSVGGTEVLYMPYNLIQNSENRRDTFDRISGRTIGNTMLIDAESLQHNQLEEIVYTVDSGMLESEDEFNSLREFNSSPIRYEVWVDNAGAYMRYLPILVNHKKQTLIQNRDRLPLAINVEIIHALKNSNYSHRWNQPSSPDMADTYADRGAPTADSFSVVVDYTTGTDLDIQHDSSLLYVEYSATDSEESSANILKAWVTSAVRKITFAPHLMHPLTTLEINNHGLVQLFGTLPYGLTRLSADTGGSLATLPKLPNTLEILELANNAITGLNNAAIPAALENVDLSGNALTVADVNWLLRKLDENGVNNGVCYLSGQTPSAAPSGAGATAKANLITKGWTVNTD